MTPESIAEAKIGYGVARPRAFIDAVVTIALTLLILPLMDSLGYAARSGDDTLTWLVGQPGANHQLSHQFRADHDVLDDQSAAVLGCRKGHRTTPVAARRLGTNHSLTPNSNRDYGANGR